MVQPNPFPHDGHDPALSQLNWKGILILIVALGLFISAYLFQDNPLSRAEEVSYPQFLEMWKSDEIDKSRDVELIAAPRIGAEFVAAYRATPAGHNPSEKRVRARITFSPETPVSITLERELGVAVTPKLDPYLQ